MKRMSAMMLSAIYVMNVLSSPSVVSLADGNGYEYVDLSADSELRNREDVEVVSDSNIPVYSVAEAGLSVSDASDVRDDGFDESGGFEKYRTYLDSEKTMFRYGDSGRIVYMAVYLNSNAPKRDALYYSNPNWHSWDDPEYLPYTHEMEVADAKAVYEAQRANASKQDMERQLIGLEQYRGQYVLTDVVTVPHPYSFENYRRGNMFDYGLPLSDAGKEDVRKYIVKKFPMVSSDNIQVQSVLRLDEFRNLGTDGTFAHATITVGDNNYDVLVPVNSTSNDLLFIDGSMEKMTIKADSLVSDDDLNTITKYLKTSRNLSEIEVTNALVRYDDAKKLYYIEADYKFSESSDIVHGRIYFMGEGSFGFMHNKELLVEYSDDKTELTDDDVATINEGLKDVKENVLSGFDIGVSDKHVEADGNMLKVRVGYNASQFLNQSCGAYSSRRLSDNDSYIWEYSVNVGYKYDKILNSIAKFDELKDKDLYVSGNTLYLTASPKTQPLADFVKAQIGGHEITSVKYIDKSYFSKSDSLIVYTYEVDGVKKYYVIRVNDSIFEGLRFRDKGTSEPTVASEELRTKVKDILREKLGDIITDVQVSEVINAGVIEFSATDVTGAKHLGYVNLDYATPGTPSPSCPPIMSRSLELLWYDSGRSTTKPHYDDDGYTPRKNEEPKPSKPEEPVSPSEIEKPSEPDAPKNEEPAPSKPVVPVSPSEIEKPVNPPVTPDKPSVPVVPKPSVPDSAKPIEKATPSNITPSSDRPNRNDSVRPTPSKPSVPQGNDSVTITKINESEGLSKDKSVAGVDRLNGNVQGEFRNTPLQSDSKPVTIGNPISRNVRTGDMSLAIVFGALAMINAFGLGFYFWKMNRQLED